MRRPPPVWWLLLGVVGLLAPRLVVARPLEVATFAVDPGVDVAGLRVAVGTDGTMVFAWQSGGGVWTQRYSQGGAPLAPPALAGTGSQVRVTPDTRGGYVLAMTRVVGTALRLFGRRLDAAGQAVGGELAVDPGDDDVVYFDVVGLPSGSVFVWQQALEARVRLYDAAGAPRTDATRIGENGAGHPLSAAPLASGGFAVVWHDPSIHAFLGRTFDGDGVSLAGPALLPGSPLYVWAIAGHPAGGFAAAGTTGASTIRVSRFSEQLGLLAEVVVASLPATDAPLPALAGDGAGNWLVVWAGARYDATGTQLVGYQLPQARPVAADLTPLEPAFALANLPAFAVATALLPSGSFVNAWSSDAGPGDPRGYANVVAPCAPGSHVCGDGVLDPRCEECDDGAANSDLVADACRTTCVLANCGDGVTDSGEGCDGGGQSPCAGCDTSCQPVVGLACGDGILVAGCADQCDDGNAVAGDGCAPQCTLERVPGGGRRSTDCYAEWVVDNPTNAPLVDADGGFNRRQRCVDDDPGCDFDGGVPGRCTFRVRVCGRNTDVAACAPPTSLVSWELVRPSAVQAAGKPALAQVRAAFASVAGTIEGGGPTDVCTGFLDVVVPMRGAGPRFGPGTVMLKSLGSGADGARDTDVLRLRCLPPR